MAVVGTYALLKGRRSKPHFVVRTVKGEGDDLGFSIGSKNRSITGVSVICDDVPRMWVVDGVEKDEVNLYVGGIPAKVFPYQIVLSSGVKPKEGQSTRVFTLTARDKKTNKVLATDEISVSVGATGTFTDTTDFLPIKSKVRLVASQIEEVKDYRTEIIVGSMVKVVQTPVKGLFSYKAEGILFHRVGRLRAWIRELLS